MTKTDEDAPDSQPSRPRSTTDDDGRHGPKTTSGYALTAAERCQIAQVVTSREIRDKSPKQGAPTLADRGETIALKSSFYRVVRIQGMVRHRESSRAPTARPRALEADGPNRIFIVGSVLRRVVQPPPPTQRQSLRHTRRPPGWNQLRRPCETAASHEEARRRHPERWSGQARDWTPTKVAFLKTDANTLWGLLCVMLLETKKPDNYLDTHRLSRPSAVAEWWAMPLSKKVGRAQAQADEGGHGVEVLV